MTNHDTQDRGGIVGGALTVALLITLAVQNAVPPMATDMYSAAFPQITASLSTTSTMVGLTLTAFFIGYAAGQVLGGAVLALVSAAWAWRSGEASNFYATGLLINAVWLAGCLLSLAAGRPLVGILMGLWRAAAGGGSARPDGGADADDAVRSGDAAARAAEHRRHRAATAVLAAMFALRLAVEVPLYLAGAAGVGALGIARLVLGLPLFALTAWFIWLLVAPSRIAQAQAAAQR